MHCCVSEAFDRHITDPTPLYENIFDPFALLPELEADRVRVAPEHCARVRRRDESALAVGRSA